MLIVCLFHTSVLAMKRATYEQLRNTTPTGNAVRAVSFCGAGHNDTLILGSGRQLRVALSSFLRTGDATADEAMKQELLAYLSKAADNVRQNGVTHITLRKDMPTP